MPSRLSKLCALALLLLSCSAGHANLTGLSLQFLATYTSPPPPNPPLAGQGGHFTVIKNQIGYDAPSWTNDLTLHVDNNFDATQIKDVYLEINWASGTGPAQPPPVQLTASVPTGNTTIITYPPVSTLDDWTYHWLVIPQPRSEDFHFNVPSMFLLQQNVQSLEFGTNCVPEPGTLAIVGIVVAAVTCRRSREPTR